MLTDEQAIESIVGTTKDDIVEDNSIPTERSSRKKVIKVAMILNNFFSYDKPHSKFFIY